jgi:hypothetical protein
MDMRTVRVSGLERQRWISRARATEGRTQSTGTERTSAKVKISPHADLMRQMAALKQQDPERFKEVLGAVSANLTAASQNPNSGEVGNDLSKLARTLDKVAKSGDLNQLSESGLQTFHSVRASNRAIDAYLKNARTAQPLTETSRQALQYVLNTLTEANQEVAPSEAVGATQR